MCLNFMFLSQLFFSYRAKTHTQTHTHTHTQYTDAHTHTDSDEYSIVNATILQMTCNWCLCYSGENQEIF